MAPGLLETHTWEQPTFHVKTVAQNVAKKLPIKYEPGRVEPEDHTQYEHDWALPRFPNIKWPPIPDLPYQEKGLLGDPNFANLLASATNVVDYTPKIGTEVSGVDLANLTDLQKNDLARLISTRGVVFFRDQKNLDINKQRELGQYFGTLHKHATTSVPQAPGLEDVHVVYTGDNAGDQRAKFAPAFLWHSDVCFSPSLSLSLHPPHNVS